MNIPYELKLKPAALPDNGTRIQSQTFERLSYPASACTKKAIGEAIQGRRLVRKSIGQITRELGEKFACY